MNRTRSLALCVLMTLSLAGCGNQLAASATLAIVGQKVTDGIFGKVVFDPIWEFFVGKPDPQQMEALKGDFAKVVAEKVLNSMIPSAHAGEMEFRCEPREADEDCRNRAASMAEHGFNIYADRFVSTFKGCRDRIVLTPETGALDYTRQVDLITECISNAGYQKEIALIMSHIQRTTS